MDKKIIAWLLSYLMTRLDSKDIKDWLDKGLDVLEDKILEEPDKYDDLVISVLKLLRHALDIPDND